MAGISKSTVSRIVRKVTCCIASLSATEIQFPEREEDRQSLKQDFFAIASFPNVVGALDCTHVSINSPGGDEGELYRNRKGYFSLNVQAVVNARLVILDLVARWPGSVHDSTIFSNSLIHARFENREIDGYLLGDGGYELFSFEIFYDEFENGL